MTETSKQQSVNGHASAVDRDAPRAGRLAKPATVSAPSGRRKSFPLRDDNSPVKSVEELTSHVLKTFPETLKRLAE